MSVFRSQQGYARYWEARGHVGALMSSVVDAASLGAVHLEADDARAAADARAELARLLRVYFMREALGCGSPQFLASTIPVSRQPNLEVSLADLFAGSPELAAAYGAPAAAEPLEAPRVAAPPRARKAPSDAKKAELAAEAAASTTGYLVPVAVLAVAALAWYYLT